MNLSEVLNSINYNKDDVFESLPDVTNKEYVPFVVNKALSYFPDTILQSNNMNMRPGLDPRMQYHYLKSSVRKKKRFSKWNRKTDSPAIEAIKKHYNYSDNKAEEVLMILTDEQMEHIVKLHTHDA